MEFWVILIFIAAAAHATWNLLLKQSKNKIVFIYLFRLTQFIIFFPLMVLLWPKEETISLSLILIIGSGTVLLHSAYALLLAKAYEKSDYSTVYPTSRGLGILITLLAGWILLNDSIHLTAIFGVCLIIIGIQFIFPSSTAKKSFSLQSSSWAIWVGVSIASFTLYDNFAVQLMTPIVLSVVENLGQIAVLSWNFFNTEKQVISKEWKTNWRNILIAGFCCGLSFWLFLTVLNMGIPVSLVAAVREISIVISILLGAMFLKEKLSVNKVIGSCVLFIGIILII